MSGGLSTPRSTLRTGYVRVLVYRDSCRHQANTHLVAAVTCRLWSRARWRCENCGSQLIDLVVAGRARGAWVKGTAASEDEAAVSP